MYAMKKQILTNRMTVQLVSMKLYGRFNNSINEEQDMHMMEAGPIYRNILIGEFMVLQNALLLPFVDEYRLSQASFELPRLRLSVFQPLRAFIVPWLPHIACCATLIARHCCFPTDRIPAFLPPSLLYL